MACERMTGLNLRLVAVQYSRASMFTLRWSWPSWQMSACARSAAGAGCGSLALPGVCWRHRAPAWHGRRLGCAPMC
jgi:hypothetical protein